MRIVCTLLLCGFLLGTETETGLAKPPNPPVSLSLDRYVGYRPLAVTARIQIDPNSLNVGWCLTWDSNYVSGRHCESVNNNGADELPIYTYTMKLETPNSRQGEDIETLYQVYATVLRVRDITNTPPQPVRVLPSPF